MQVVHAAHIHPYRGRESNHVTNGLLLRSDLHDLFDLDLLGISPENLLIHLHPALDTSMYFSLEGEQLSVREAKAPSREALHTRWEEFQTRVRKNGD